MKYLTFIISLCILFKVCPLLTKYGTETIYDKFVIFDSKDFKNDEEMHFKIQTHKDNFYNYDHSSSYIYDIQYYFSSNLDFITTGRLLEIDFKKTTYEDFNLETKYFTIKKKRNDYSGSNGNYIYIEFPGLLFYTYHNYATITNTEEDEGKIETWVIVVIVVVIVAIIAGIIIFCVCRRIRMRKAQQAAAQANAATIAAQNQAAANYANYAAQNAAYAAAAQNAQNAYIAEQNYQAQVNQAQVYQDNNYMSPPGAVPDAGYTSKAVI